jgi:hypothetical protein
MSFFFLPLLAHGFCKRKNLEATSKKEIEAQQQHCCKQPKGWSSQQNTLLHKQLLPSNTFETCSLTLLGSVLSRAAQISENAEHLPRLGCTLVGLATCFRCFSQDGYEMRPGPR